MLTSCQGTLKFSKMDKFLTRTFEICINEQENVPSASNFVKKQKIVKRQCRENFIHYGFSLYGNEDAPKLLSVIYGEQLANEAMVPSKLMRHLNTPFTHTVHAVHAHKNKTYFQRMSSKNKKAKVFYEVGFRRSIRSQLSCR